MFIDCTYNKYTGEICHMYVDSTFPEKKGEPLISIDPWPEHLEYARIILSIFDQMEIDQHTGKQAVIDIKTGRPIIVEFSKKDFMVNKFKIDLSKPPETPFPERDIVLNPMIKIRSLVRKGE